MNALEPLPLGSHLNQLLLHLTIDRVLGQSPSVSILNGILNGVVDGVVNGVVLWHEWGCRECGEQS